MVTSANRRDLRPASLVGRRHPCRSDVVIGRLSLPHRPGGGQRRARQHGRRLVLARWLLKLAKVIDPLSEIYTIILLPAERAQFSGLRLRVFGLLVLPVLS